MRSRPIALAACVAGTRALQLSRNEYLAERSSGERVTGGELFFLVAADAYRARHHRDEWVSVQMLVAASILLPCVAEPHALLTVDVPAALREVALGMELCADLAGACRLADAAKTMLARHLVDAHLAVPLQPGGPWSLRDWLVMADLSTAVAQLRAAAYLNRSRLLAAEAANRTQYCPGPSAGRLPKRRSPTGRRSM